MPPEQTGWPGASSRSQAFGGLSEAWGHYAYSAEFMPMVARCFSGSCNDRYSVHPSASDHSYLSPARSREHARFLRVARVRRWASEYI